MQADEETRQGRVRLVTATKYVLANALKLLGIEAPEVM
jgi:arginyl-tRNA synthetase